MTTWDKKDRSTDSSWDKRVWVTSDNGLFLDNSGNYIIDTEWNRIKVHTWIFYEYDTDWKKARI